MRQHGFRWLLAGCLALAVIGCRPDPKPDSVLPEQTEWVARPDGFQERYALQQMVVLSRHNIRSPLVGKGSVLTRLTNASYSWFPWEGAPSTLTLKGERLETLMGGFFREWLGRKGMLDDYAADPQSFRFYANGKQRCQLTARRFADALLPGASPRVELNVQFDAMDPVFAPQITKLSDAFVKKAQQEIRDRFGDLDRSASAGYAMLEKVIDITHSPAYPDTTSFSQFPSSVSFKLNAEPAMSGGLKMACSVSDALSLQYYEEADLQKAGFGHALSFDDWVTAASVKDLYGDALFTAPSVAVNVAHPLLQEILGEVQNRRRVFTLLCGHDSNIASVLASLGAVPVDLPGSIEQRTPIGSKLVFEVFQGKDGVDYADVLLMYASATQLRSETALSYSTPPAVVRIRLEGLRDNADGLYTLHDVEDRLLKAIVAYDAL